MFLVMIPCITWMLRERWATNQDVAMKSAVMEREWVNINKSKMIQEGANDTHNIACIIDLWIIVILAMIDSCASPSFVTITLRHVYGWKTKIMKTELDEMSFHFVSVQYLFLDFAVILTIMDGYWHLNSDVWNLFELYIDFLCRIKDSML
jgi:hypothetical protein